MKTKHLYIAGLLALLLIVGFFILRKVRGALNLSYTMGAPRPIGSWLSSLSGLKMNIPIILKNFAPDSYKVSQIKAALYTRAGNLIAEQAQPLSQAFTIAPHSNSELLIPFEISLTGLTAWASQEKVSLERIPGMVKSFFSNETFGLPAVVKGFIAAEGLQVSINEQITV